MTFPQSGASDAAHGIGQRLRDAREQAGLGIAEVSARLKMPSHVVEALEQENWSKLGAPVFVKGQVRSYARLLGLPADALVDGLDRAISAPAEIVPRSFTPKIQRVAEQTRMRLVYVVLTAAIAVPTWLATQSHLDGDALDDTLSLDPAGTTAGTEATGVSGDAGQGTMKVEPRPLVASMTPMPQRAAQAVPATDMTISFSGESWIKVTAADGSVLEQALVQPGQQRLYTAGQIGQAVLGNATGVVIRYRGQNLDLTPYIRANVVRFTVSSDGSLQPIMR